MNSSKRALSTLVGLFLLVNILGCLTIIKGSDQVVEVVSQPDQAEVLVNGVSLGTTPTTLNLKRNETHRITLKLNGYQPTEVILNSKFQPLALVNICVPFSGVIGLAVDFITGAAFQLTPEQVSAQLSRQGAQIDHVDPDTVYLFTTMDPDPAWELIAQMEPE